MTYELTVRRYCQTELIPMGQCLRYSGLQTGGLHQRAYPQPTTEDWWDSNPHLLRFRERLLCPRATVLMCRILSFIYTILLGLNRLRLACDYYSSTSAREAIFFKSCPSIGVVYLHILCYLACHFGDFPLRVRGDSGTLSPVLPK